MDFVLKWPAGEMAAIITVAELPPRDSCNNLVNLWYWELMRERDSVNRERDREIEIERVRKRECDWESEKGSKRERVCENDRWSDRLANAGRGRQINGEREW